MTEVKPDARLVVGNSRAQWKQPQVRRIVAGSAEASPQNSGDGLTGS